MRGTVRGRQTRRSGRSLSPLLLSFPSLDLTPKVSPTVQQTQPAGKGHSHADATAASPLPSSGAPTLFAASSSTGAPLGQPSSTAGERDTAAHDGDGDGNEDHNQDQEDQAAHPLGSRAAPGLFGAPSSRGMNLSSPR